MLAAKPVGKKYFLERICVFPCQRFRYLFLADSEISKLTIKMEVTICYKKAAHFYVTRTVID